MVAYAQIARYGGQISHATFSNRKTYMPQAWIPVGALGDAFEPDNNCLPPVQDLAGRTMTLHFEGGLVIRHDFGRDNTIHWQIIAGEGAKLSDTDTCVTTRPRAGVYFVDFVKGSERAASVSLVLDLDSGVCLAAIGQLPDAGEAASSPLDRIAAGRKLSDVKCTFLRGTIDTPFAENAPMPKPTLDLVGKRVEYRYSKEENYEHIYLNEHFYTWHCLEGSELGLCDTDACHYYKVRDDLYLFVWCEKIIPTLGIICIDFRSMKTTGKIFGYESNDLTTTRNFGVGAYAKVISIVTR